jgi:tripartite-type tricarboxylate transporter receptor subunit TctC
MSPVRRAALATSAGTPLEGHIAHSAGTSRQRISPHSCLRGELGEVHVREPWRLWYSPVALIGAAMFLLRLTIAATMLLGWLIGMPLASASAQQGFGFRDRTITIYTAGSAGGGYDFYARLLARHLGAHLPGNPTVVVKNMPGAGGVLLANYLAGRASRDGTEIGALEHGTAFTSLLTRSRVDFDAAKLGWLGSMDQFTPIVAVWHTVPVYSADDLTAHSINVGTSGAGSTTSGYPRALNAILGTKMKVIGGYPGSAEINLAIERGELDGVASWCWTCAKAEKPDWIAEHKLRVVMQLAAVGDPELTQMKIPTAFERAKTDEQRRMLDIVFGSVAMSRPFAMPPGLPAERLALLRAAFAAAVKDPALIADADAKGFLVNFVSAAALEEIVTKAFVTDPALVEKVREVYSGE